MAIWRRPLDKMGFLKNGDSRHSVLVRPQSPNHWAHGIQRKLAHYLARKARSEPSGNSSPSYNFTLAL